MIILISEDIIDIGSDLVVLSNFLKDVYKNYFLLTVQKVFKRKLKLLIIDVECHHKITMLNLI